ncbi:MAG: phosphate/phosphite/phosphonate ABC transporter substrate-binding protein [Proteobacteria bacterium]|nr:phosphate/phosphite/phosphonate ABC transporter substrate-binding protein [Pseudomonadota bacterium]
MKRKYPFFVLFITLSLLFGCQGKEGIVSGKEDKPIKIAYMICNSLPETTARFEPITAYLSEKTGRKFESIYVNTFDFEDLVRDKKVDFTHTNSILPIIFKKEYGLELIAVEKRGRYGYRDTGTIITLKESGIKSFDDMRGKTMIFGPALAPFGYMAQYNLMLANGFDPEEDLAFYVIPWGSFKHEKVVYAVLFGAYDVGAAPRLDLDHMAQEGKINIDDFNIIAESIPMPYCTVGVMPHVDSGLAQEVKEILLNLKKDETVLVNGEVLRILDSAWIDGFVEANDKEYDTIREHLKKCNMAPYKKY